MQSKKNMTNKTDEKQAPLYVIIPAAGSAERFGGDIPKQYLPLLGKPVLRHVVEKFLALPYVVQICVVIRECDADLYHDAVLGLDTVSYVIGSNDRKLSVYSGLNSFSKVKKTDKILIHDAARPCVCWDDIQAVIDALDTHKAATLSHGVFDTVMDIENENTIDRSQLKAIQTPQGFHFGVLMAAHEKFKDDNNFTDDAGLVIANGGTVHFVNGGRENIKITTQDDMNMAQAIMGTQISLETRSGQGFDVHAFDYDVQSDVIRLGGIDIPHDHPLKGHSDADVALHTITDALLGGIGQGDIGQHFPPSDDQWKGKDSSYFLEEAVGMMKEAGGKLINVDLTVICEAPKLTAYRDAMRARIAEIMNCGESRVNVKATTTEKLGFTGRKEGIAAQALVNVTLPVHN